MFTLFGTCVTPPSLGPKKQPPLPPLQASTMNNKDEEGGGLFSLGGSGNSNPLTVMLGSTFQPPKGKEGKKALRLLGNVFLSVFFIMFVYLANVVCFGVS
jgi:hypothetical protein